VRSLNNAHLVLLLDPFLFIQSPIDEQELLQTDHFGGVVAIAFPSFRVVLAGHQSRKTSADPETLRTSYSECGPILWLKPDIAEKRLHTYVNSFANFCEVGSGSSRVSFMGIYD